jgi:UDP-glucose 4-epimerase
VHVADIARANCLALEADITAPFVAMNIGTGVATDVNQLADHIRSIVEKRWQTAGVSNRIPPYRHGEPRSGDLRSNLVNADLAYRHLKWKPTLSIVEGLQNTVEWFAHH